MGTLTGLLGTVRNALLSDQVAITATATNIANQNTAGYTRRTVTWSENDTVQIGSVAVGTGTTATVTSQRDRILDRSVQQATDTAAASTTRLNGLQNVQSLFALDTSGNDSAGIQTALSGFFKNVSALAADPTSTSARQTTLAAAQGVAAAFNRTAAQLSFQQGILNTQVATGVNQVNGLLTAIANKNNAIATSGPGSDTSAFQDQRTTLITQLSSLIGLQQTTAENGAVSLSTINGTLLVGGSRAFSLSTTDVAGTTRVLAAGSAGGDITSGLQGGSIGGSIQVRDTDLPTVRSQLDALAYSFASTVNAQNQAGNTSSGTPGGAVFAIPLTSAGAAAGISVTLSAPSGLAAASSTEGSGGNTNANALLALQNAPTVNGQIYSAAFGSLLSNLGTTVSQAKTDSTANTAIQSQLSTQRDTVSGISLDEEAANLTQYQRSYQAAAKVLSIINSLLATAINLGTNTPVN